MTERILKNEEKAILSLRALYRRYGYLPYKMSKFEGYDLYVRHKDFLVGDRVITFNDTNGKLLALKPDVTLSIVKNGSGEPLQKVYYNENVYRVSDSTHRFKEIMQAGLECIGEIDLYQTYEVVALAAESLGVISEDHVLEVGHLGILSAVLEEACADRDFQNRARALLSQKNEHDLVRLCGEYGVSGENTGRLRRLIGAAGERREVLDRIAPLCERGAAKEAYDELCRLSAMLDGHADARRIRFDFSVGGDAGYYSGIVCKGFLSGVSAAVLAGGRYDNLMKKMGRKEGAIGFALYLDLLEQIAVSDRRTDVDVLLLYGENDAPEKVAGRVKELTAAGKTVRVQKQRPVRLRRGEEEQC